MSDDPKTTEAPDLARDTARLADAIEGFAEHRFVRLYQSPLRMIGFQFARGLAFGLGTVIGASALVSVLVLFLSQFEFIPIIGNWATQIIQEIQAAPE